MIIRFTEKLSKKLKLGKITKVEKFPGSYLDWYAHLFSFQRTQYIITTEANSLYTTVMYGRGIVDDNRFIQQFMSLLRDQLEDIDCQIIFERIIAPKSHLITMSKTINKSVLGSMNDMVSMSKLMLDRDDMGPLELAEMFNKTPFKYIEYQRPIDAFKGLKLKNNAV